MSLSAYECQLYLPLDRVTFQQLRDMDRATAETELPPKYVRRSPSLSANYTVYPPRVRRNSRGKPVALPGCERIREHAAQIINVLQSASPPAFAQYVAVRHTCSNALKQLKMENPNSSNVQFPFVQRELVG